MADITGITNLTSASAGDVSLTGIKTATTNLNADIATKQGTLTNSAGLLAALSDETGTGLAVFNTSPTLITPILGVATATSINGLTITTSSGTLTVANNASASLLTSGNFALTLTSTATTNSTFPSGIDTLVGLAAVQTVSGAKTFNDAKLLLNGVTSGAMTIKAPAVASTYIATFPAATGTVDFAMTTTEASNAAPAPAITGQHHTHTITALAAATVLGVPTSTMTLNDTNSLIYRIKDNGTARGITYNAIYRASSDLALPSTTIISKTLYLGFRYNAADSKWDLLAVLNNF